MVVYLDEYEIATFSDVSFPGESFQELIDLSSLSLPNGEYDLKVTAFATDLEQTEAEAIEDVEANAVIIDKTSPQVYITTPTATPIYVKDNLDLSADATDVDGSDPGTGIDFVEFSYQPRTTMSPSPTVIASVTATPYSTTWDVSGVEDGEYILKANAWDIAGNYAEPDSVEVTVDKTAPLATVTAPNGGEAYTGGQTVDITWTATDANLDGYPVTIELYDGDALYSTIASGEDNDGSYSWVISEVAAGSNYKIKISVEDLAGNVGCDASDAPFTVGEFSVDLISPVESYEWLSGMVEFSAEVLDPSIIQDVKFYSSINEGTPVEIGSGFADDGNIYSLTASLLTDGEAMQIIVIATNNFDKTAQDSVVINYDNTAPYIEIDGFDDEYEELSAPEFTGWAYDELSGLSSVKVEIYDYTADLFWDGTDWVDYEVSLDAVVDDYNGEWYYDTSSVKLVSGNVYQYYAEAEDLAGNTDYDYYEFGYRETDYIYLAPGWNFISIPRNVTAEHDTWGEVFAAMEWGSEYITEAWGYNAFAVTPWFQLKASTPVEALTGYWLYFDCEQLDYGEEALLTMAPAIEGVTSKGYEALAVRIHYDNSGKTVPASKVLKGNAWNAIGPSGWIAYYPHPVASELASLKDSWSTLIAWNPIIQE